MTCYDCSRDTPPPGSTRFFKPALAMTFSSDIYQKPCRSEPANPRLTGLQEIRWGHTNVPSSPVCHEETSCISLGRRSYTGQRAAKVSVVFLVNPEQSQNVLPVLDSATMNSDCLSR